MLAEHRSAEAGARRHLPGRTIAESAGPRVRARQRTRRGAQPGVCADYAELLKFFDSTGAAVGDWTTFFNSDVSALLAVPAIEDLDEYTSNTQSWFDYLNETENQAKTAELKDRFGYLYGSVASLARRLDDLMRALPGDAPLRGTLQNLIQTQLAPALKRLIAYYKAGVGFGLVNAVVPPVQILRAPAVSFDSVLNAGPAPALSSDWSEGQAWAVYAVELARTRSGPAAGVRANQSPLDTSLQVGFDQFEGFCPHRR